VHPPQCRSTQNARLHWIGALDQIQVARRDLRENRGTLRRREPILEQVSALEPLLLAGNPCAVDGSPEDPIDGAMTMIGTTIAVLAKRAAELGQHHHDGVLPFAAEGRPVQLSAAFAELREAVASVAGGRDVETLTEVLWAALHGLTTLGHNDRLRPGRETERIELLVSQFYDASSRNLEKR